MPNRTESAIAPIDAGMQEQLQADLLRLRRACGCREALAAMLLASTGAGCFAYAYGSPNVALTVGGASFGGALIGKIAGLVVARIRLHVLLHGIERANRKLEPARAATVLQ